MTNLLLRNCVTLVLVGVLFVGCSSPTDTSQAAPDQPATPTEIEQKPPEEIAPDPNDIWKETFDAAAAHVEAEEFDEAEEQLAKLDELFEDPDEPNDEQLAKVADLKKQIDDRRKEVLVQQREQNLVQAQDHMKVGKLNEAREALRKVTASAPTDEQRSKVRALEAEIDRQSRARRELQYSVRLLKTEERSAFIEAKNNLLRQRTVALGMMLEASTNVDEPILAANSLRVLTLLRNSKASLPATLDVLQRPEQKEIWPVAIEEIVATRQPGAGPRLLEMSTSSDMPEQRMAALNALSQVVDPPNHTLLALLGLIGTDGPELDLALRAALHAVTVHHQQDLLAHRGFDEPLTEKQSEALSKLPERLRQITETAVTEENANLIRAGKALAFTTRQLSPEPLANVKVLRVDAEAEDGPATAVLDGVWNSVELNTMWRHPIDKQSTITLDLGETRTVIGVRLWNFNQTSGTQRGWKEVDVFVSDSAVDLNRSARGIVPKAPGVADTPDYGSVVPVPFVRGRYVRLSAKSLWANDAHTGLSEIQILGF